PIPRPRSRPGDGALCRRRLLQRRRLLFRNAWRGGIPLFLGRRFARRSPPAPRRWLHGDRPRAYARLRRSVGAVRSHDGSADIGEGPFLELRRLGHGSRVAQKSAARNRSIILMLLTT